MAVFTDTHAHLTWKTYDGRIGDVVARAKKAGLLMINDIGTDLESSRRACEHAKKFHEIYFSAGIHPSDAGAAKENDLAEIENLCLEEKCIAVGETGLDYYRDFTKPEVQQNYFREQLRLAKKINKPVIIHDRKASEDILKILDDEKFDGINGLGGVFHCFNSNVKIAREVLERGFYISFTGNITFKKSDRPEIAKIVPLDRLLLETDSPFMAPVPHRGHDNEPAYIPYVAATHATTRGISLEEVAEQTTRNALKLFNIKNIDI